MNLPKVILPPALSLLLLVVVIYGIGSCMASVPQAYRVRGPWVVETTPEREIVVADEELGAPLTISIFSWGAIFSSDDHDLGTLRYERVYYTLRDSSNALVWKMTSHDTCVVVTDVQNSELFRIVRYRDRIEFVDGQGQLFAYVLISGGTASLHTADGSLIATATAMPSGSELRTPDGMTV